MKRNERVLDFMGWAHTLDNDLNDIRLAKLLQARMRQDGWQICILDYDDGFSMSAAKGETTIFVAHVLKEPAALVALFAKVYGITEEA
jgi:hypothetical protein